MDFRKFSEKGTPYLRVANIKENKIDTTDIKYVPLVLSKIKKDVHLQINDVLITRKGTFGRAALVRDGNEFLISSEIFRIRLLEGVSPKYFVFTNNTSFVQAQMKQKAVGAIMGSLSQEALKSILIPLPPRPIQDKIANMMDKAYGIKKEKEAEAEELINSINDYILQEFGIQLPKMIEEKNFTITFDNIIRRFDPFHYLDFDIIENIRKGKYHTKKLIDINNIIIESGRRPKGGVRHLTEGIISIGGEHINREGGLDLNEPRYVLENFFRKLKKGRILHGDILIVKDGATTGKTAIVTEDFPYKNACINEHVFRIAIKNEIDSIYLFAIIFSSIGQRQINRVISGAAQKGIVKKNINEILIPVSPLFIQQKIAQETRLRLETAKKLKQEAKEILSKAKEKVEQIILREDSLENYL